MTYRHTTLTPADEGKRVLDASGDEIGYLAEVSDGRGYVVPDPSIVDVIKVKLGWGEIDNAHPFDEGSIAEITDDVVRLRGTL